MYLTYCYYKPTAGESGLFQVKASAYRDTAGNAGVPGSYNTWGITVETGAPAAPKLALKYPTSSPGRILSPTFTATLSKTGGTLRVWNDERHCGGSTGQGGIATVKVTDTTPPYTVEFTHSGSNSITSAGSYHYWAQHEDADSNRSPCVLGFTYVYDPDVPHLQIGSTGPYYEGDWVQIYVNFGNVPSGHTLKVRGRPAIWVNVGGSKRQAFATPSMVSGNIVSFYYRVGPDDYDRDGISVDGGKIFRWGMLESQGASR